MPPTPRRRRAACLAIAVLAVCSGRALAVASPIRSEIPIHEVDLSDGTRRYTIPVKVGGTALEAGLDTGSTGLRVMPNSLADSDAKPSGGNDDYSYGSGARLDGRVGTGVVTIGALSAPITLQLVSHIGCTARLPACPASRVSQSEYGVQGDGLRGEGFRAIIGVNMAQAEVVSPLRALGADRWIVELPRPGDTTPGRLILNPTDAEVGDFVRLPVVARYADQRGGLHDSVPGCLVNLGSHARACGPVMLDTGAPGISVHGGGLGARPWPELTKAALVFGDTGGRPLIAETLQIGLRSHASHLMFQDADQGSGAVIYSGLTAYFAFSVLYDPVHSQLGLKARPPMPNGPTPSQVAP